MSAGWPYAPYAEPAPLEAVYADALAMAPEYPVRLLPALGHVDLHDTGADWHDTGADWRVLTGELSAQALLNELYDD